MIKLTKKRKPGKGIIDNSKNVLIETIPFYENGTIETMQVSLDLEHPSIGDLVIKMRSPSGLEVLLHNREAMESTTLNEVYDQEIMAPFADSNLRGNWTLIVEDQVANEEGILYSWSIGLDYFEAEEKEAVAAVASIDVTSALEVEAEAAPEEELSEEVSEVAAVAMAAEALTEEAVAEEIIEVEAEAAPEETAGAEAAPEEAASEEESSVEAPEESAFDKIQEEVEAGNGDIIALENDQLLAMLGGKKVNLGKIAGKIEGNGDVYLELIKK